MWTFMVAVAFGGRGVDANLRILQVIGSPESRFFTWFSFSLAPASCLRVPKASNRVSAGKELKNLASTSLVAKLISQDIDDQIPCRLLPFLVCSVLGEFPTEPVTSEAHPYPHRKFLEWLIEEIGVVEEMIRRKVPSIMCVVVVEAVVRPCELVVWKHKMWTFMVAVAFGGRGVDANLRILQVIGSPESRFFTWFSFSLAPASCPRVPKASNRVSAGKELKNLASTSLVAKLISQDIDGQIPCRLLP
ncbi:hypothetical protein Taro_005326, partial [Colocasia esculenta]|nr:hypothetical protein [Colocasia esculenta]